jgi:hypothetical protein
LPPPELLLPLYIFVSRHQPFLCTEPDIFYVGKYAKKKWPALFMQNKPAVLAAGTPATLAIRPIYHTSIRVTNISGDVLRLLSPWLKPGVYGAIR